MLVYAGGTVRVGHHRVAPPDADVILLHRRLAIIDLSDTGWQPMSTRDGRYHVVFNGEIYNYLELRRQLEAEGVAFASRSDTEVLLQAVATWGENAWRRFTGMFACAILDMATGRVILARDPFGIKPLYYVTRPGALAFASEIKALLSLPGVSRAADPQRLAAYLRFGVTDHGDGTLFSAVRQLPPGSVLDVDIATPSTPAPRVFWQPARPGTAELSFDDAAARVRDLFLESVALHLRSDVPVACCLSGGIDSSSIAMAMREVSGPALELHTFSHVVPAGALNEERWIDLVNGASGAWAHKIAPTADEMAEELEALVAVQDEPFLSSSIYAQYRVMRAIAEAKVKVVLDGQGADEMLGGYDFYLGARVASLLRAGRLGRAGALMRRARASRGIPVLRQLGDAMDFLLPAAGSALGRRLVGRGLLPPWVNRAWFDARGARVDSPRTAADADVLLESLERSIRGPGLPQLLRYEDRNSMAWSIESRVPFLTTTLVDFVLSLPESYIIGDDGTTKRVFRAAMRGLVPDPILDRRDKIGFATPEREWILAVAPWVDRLLAHEAARRIPALDHAAIRDHWRAVRDGRRSYDPSVWRWINLVEWTRRHEVDYA